MRSAPPKIIEKIVGLLIPPACREEVLGDLSEICTSSGQYIREAIRVIPMVILSRLRRTADPLVLVIEATALYLFFMGAAWYQGKSSLFEDSCFLRLAIPPAWVLFGLLLDEVYTSPGKRSPLTPTRGPLLGLAFAYLSQLALSAGNPVLALPPWIMFYGSAVGLLFSVTVKILFPPVANRQLGAGGPALWIKHVPEPLRMAPEAISVIKTIAIVLALAFVAGQVGGRALSMALVLISVVFLILRELSRRY